MSNEHSCAYAYAFNLFYGCAADMKCKCKYAVISLFYVFCVPDMCAAAALYRFSHEREKKYSVTLTASRDKTSFVLHFRVVDWSIRLHCRPILSSEISDSLFLVLDSYLRNRRIQPKDCMSCTVIKVKEIEKPKGPISWLFFWLSHRQTA